MKANLPTSEEQGRLAVRAQAGDLAARDALVEANLGLLRQLAYSFAKVTPGVEVDDLIQEGAFAVLDALRWFDPDRGYVFGTYAADCIRRRIAKYLEKRNSQPISQEPTEVDGENVMDGVIDIPEAFKSRSAEIRASLVRLPWLNRRVIEMRIGFDGEPSHWASIAQTLGVKPSIAKGMFEDGVSLLNRKIPEPSAN